MSRLSLFTLCTVFALIVPLSAHAQVKDQFVQALVDFANAANGPTGDEGAALTKAIDAMAEGLAQWDTAIGRMESGLAAEIGAAPAPVAARMRTALGAGYLERGRLDAALSQFDTAAMLDPNFAEVHILKGLANELANRPAAAGADYRAAYQRQPGDMESAYRALHAAGAAGDSSLSEEVSGKLAVEVEKGAAPGDRVAAFVTANLLDDASVSSPVFLPAAYADGLALLAASRFSEAVDAFRKAAASDTLVTDRAAQSEEVKRGAAELRRQNVTSAISLFTTVVERAPESSEAHRLLGLALSFGRRYAASVEQLKTAIRLNQRDERSRLALADVLFESGDPAGTREVLVELTQVFPRSAQAHWKLARLHQTLGDETSALQSFKAALALPLLAGRNRLLTSVGRIQHGQLDLDGAAVSYARRVELTPNDAAAHIDLGDVCRAQDRFDAALAEYSIASLLEPTNVRALAAAAQIHAAAGRDDAAVKLLRRAVALDSSHLEARYALGRALMRVGLTDEGKRELQVFEQLQQKAMQDERRRFQENQIRIDETLKNGGRQEPAR